MAIVKAANHPGTKLGALINYVLDNDKVQCVSVSGLLTTDMSPEAIIAEMRETKQLFDKEGGREVYHIIISYHPDEKITPEEANQLAQELFERIPEFQDHEAVFATQIHPDGNGCIHTHIIVNTVNFMNGSKLHTDRQWLQDLKDVSDDICRENDLAVCEKGKDFYGNDIDRNEPWDMATYQKKHELDDLPFDIEMAKEIEKAAACALDQEDFISILEDDYGISVTWEDSRKYITFEDEDGHKIRNNRLERDFGLECDKDTLLADFKRNFESFNEIDESIFDIDTETEGDKADLADDNDVDYDDWNDWDDDDDDWDPVG